MTDSSEDYIVEVDHLGFSRDQRRIFDDLNIKIRRGEITAIMGPSGTGKTTLLRLITGQLVPESGTVKVNGLLVSQLTRGDLRHASALTHPGSSQPEARLSYPR